MHPGAGFCFSWLAALSVSSGDVLEFPGFTDYGGGVLGYIITGSAADEGYCLLSIPGIAALPTALHAVRANVPPYCL